LSKAIHDKDLSALYVLRRIMQPGGQVTDDEEAEALETLNSGDDATASIDRLCVRVAELEMEVKSKNAEIVKLTEIATSRITPRS
jgi:hypothetical protein